MHHHTLPFHVHLRKTFLLHVNKTRDVASACCAFTLLRLHVVVWLFFIHLTPQRKIHHLLHLTTINLDQNHIQRNGENRDGDEEPAEEHVDERISTVLSLMGGAPHNLVTGLVVEKTTFGYKSWCPQHDTHHHEPKSYWEYAHGANKVHQEATGKANTWSKIPQIYNISMGNHVTGDVHVTRHMKLKNFSLGRCVFLENFC